MYKVVVDMIHYTKVIRFRSKNAAFRYSGLAQSKGFNAFVVAVK